MYILLLFILIGVILSLSGNSIPTDGSGRIVITDINPDGDNDMALICQSELSLSDGGDWFLHPTQQTIQQTTDERIEATDPRGWRSNRATLITIITIGNSEPRRRVRLRRDDSIASGGRALEGVFTCDIPGDTNTPVSVGIYYPSESHVKSFTYVIHLAIVVYFIVYIINAFVFSKYQFPYNNINNNFMHFYT